MKVPLTKALLMKALSTKGPLMPETSPSPEMTRLKMQAFRKRSRQKPAVFQRNSRQKPTLFQKTFRQNRKRFQKGFLPASGSLRFPAFGHCRKGQ